MPIFDYQCLHCAHIIEDVIQNLDHDLKFCPECGTDNMRRLIGRANFHLKGDGWYKSPPKEPETTK